jgi:hypothetical protein
MPVHLKYYLSRKKETKAGTLGLRCETSKELMITKGKCRHFQIRRAKEYSVNIREPMENVIKRRLNVLKKGNAKS